MAELSSASFWRFTSRPSSFRPRSMLAEEERHVYIMDITITGCFRDLHKTIHSNHFVKVKSKCSLGYLALNTFSSFLFDLFFSTTSRGKRFWTNIQWYVYYAIITCLPTILMRALFIKLIFITNLQLFKMRSSLYLNVVWLLNWTKKNK
jgi:hypothetical protein